MFYPEATASDDRDDNITKIRDVLNWTDAFVLGSPDYHGSTSGVLKNFLDYYFNEFVGKTLDIFALLYEKGLTVMDQVQTVVRQCYGWTMPYSVSINGEQDFEAKGDIRNMRLAQRLEMLAGDLVMYGRQIREPFNRDLISSESNTFDAHHRV